LTALPQATGAAGPSTRSIGQLTDRLAIDQTTLTRRINLLERDGLMERVPHPDGRVKAIRLTAKGSRMLETARPLWAQAQAKVLRALGAEAWADTQGRLSSLSQVAIKRRRAGRMRRQVERPETFSAT
jgi:DNA-binding MarR family transcriptional regulator